ncbi:MAG: hypothetical protein KDA97_14685, partial [Acidimicrobiales bacterium]|nr:hypothetical protein [Acidimicrobiales bacterium]
GSASWISGRIGATGRLVRQAWGAEQIDDLPDRLRTVPYWLAAVAGLVAYRSSPLGGIDMGFRYERFGGDLTGTEIAVAFAFATAVTVPSAWALAVVTRAEEAPWSQRWPIPAAVAGAVVFCLLAVGHEFVLFSGQQAIQHLEGLSTSTLVYLAVAKWLALVVALLAGWRGGPIFPMYLAIAATAVAVADGLDVRTDVVVIAGIGALGVILLKGNVAGSLILSLYVAPLSYTGVVLVGAVAGASMLVVGRAAGLLPAPPEDEGQSSSASSSRRSRLRMRSPVSPK